MSNLFVDFSTCSPFRWLMSHACLYGIFVSFSYSVSNLQLATLSYNNNHNTIGKNNLTIEVHDCLLFVPFIFILFIYLFMACYSLFVSFEHNVFIPLFWYFSQSMSFSFSVECDVFFFSLSFGQIFAKYANTAFNIYEHNTFAVLETYCFTKFISDTVVIMGSEHWACHSFTIWIKRSTNKREQSKSSSNIHTTHVYSCLMYHGSVIFSQFFFCFPIHVIRFNFNGMQQCKLACACCSVWYAMDLFISLLLLLLPFYLLEICFEFTSIFMPSMLNNKTKPPNRWLPKPNKTVNKNTLVWNELWLEQHKTQ